MSLSPRIHFHAHTRVELYDPKSLPINISSTYGPLLPWPASDLKTRHPCSAHEEPAAITEKSSCEELSSSFVFDHTFVRHSTESIDVHYEIQRGDILGEGGFSQVVVGKLRGKSEPHAKRAIKCINKARMSHKERLEREVEIHKKMNHVGIARLYETFEDARKQYLVLELCEGDELFKYISEHGRISEKSSSCCMGQILGAINYMHSQSIVHRDIKLENVLLTRKWLSEEEYPEIKLVDFGLARYYKQDSGSRMKTLCGTLDYLSPQQLAGKGYDEKCDIWSCGVLAYAMLSGGLPFFAETDTAMKRKIREGTVTFPDAQWKAISFVAKDLIKHTLAYDEKQRPSADIALQAKWITEAHPTFTAPPNPLPSLLTTPTPTRQDRPRRVGLPRKS